MILNNIEINTKQILTLILNPNFEYGEYQEINQILNVYNELFVKILIYTYNIHTRLPSICYHACCM